MALLRIDPQAVTIENRGTTPLNVYKSVELPEYTMGLDAGLNFIFCAWIQNTFQGVAKVQDCTGPDLMSTPPVDTDADAPTGGLFDSASSQIASIKGGYIVELFDKTGARTFRGQEIVKPKVGLNPAGVAATLYYGAVESLPPDLLSCEQTAGFTLNYWANLVVNETNYSTGKLRLTATGFVDKNNSATFHVLQDQSGPVFPKGNNIAEFEQGGHGAPYMEIPFTIN